MLLGYSSPLWCSHSKQGIVTLNTINLMMQNCFYWYKNSVPSFPHQYSPVLLTNKEEPIGNSGSLGCNDNEIVEFKVLRDVGRRAAECRPWTWGKLWTYMDMEAVGTQTQEKITVTQWSAFVSEHRMSHAAELNVWICNDFSHGSSRAKCDTTESCDIFDICCQIFKPGTP